MPLKFTNKYGIPQHIVDAIVRDDHRTDGYISVTSITKPAQEVYLLKNYECRVDVSDAGVLAAFWGTAMHEYMEKKEKSAETEQTLSTEIDGIKFSGTFDRFEDGILEDFKFCKTIQCKDEKYRKSWEEQLNIYNYLLFANGKHVKEAYINAFLKDWDYKLVGREDWYPPIPFRRFKIKLHPLDQVKKAIVKHIKRHKAVKESGNPPMCTKDEMWMRNDGWLVKNANGNTLSRHITKEAAEKDQKMKLQNKGQQTTIVHAPGTPMKCTMYCMARSVCNQIKTYKQYYKSKTGKDLLLK